MTDLPLRSKDYTSPRQAAQIDRRAQIVEIRPLVAPTALDCLHQHLRSSPTLALIRQHAFFSRAPFRTRGPPDARPFPFDTHPPRSYIPLLRCPARVVSVLLL